MVSHFLGFKIRPTANWDFQQNCKTMFKACPVSLWYLPGLVFYQQIPQNTKQITHGFISEQTAL